MFDFIKKFMLEKNYPPTVREIADGVGLKSTSSVHDYLLDLRDDGRISFVDDSPRTITIDSIHYVEDKGGKEDVTGV